MSNANAKIRAISHAFKTEDRKERKRIRRQGRSDKRALAWI